MKHAFVAALTATLSLHSHAETMLKPVVTASRVAQTADQNLTAVTVIERDQIESTQSQSLPEVLGLLVPGLDFSTTGGVGHQVSAFLRGTASDNVLVLIDGNIIGSATTGATALELIPLQHIERIEVVRGPRSSLYGSDAIGGVIQLFTRSGQGQNTAAISAGSRNTYAAQGMFSYQGEATGISLSANHLTTDGFDVTNDNEADDDGYVNSSLNLRVNTAVGDASSLSLRLLHADGETEFDNQSFGNVSDSVQQSIGLGFDSSPANAWSTRINLGRTLDRLETDRNTEDFFTPGVFSFERTLFETRRDQARWENKITFSDTGHISAGLDYIDDQVESTTAYATNERSNRGMYALLQDKFGRHQLQLSGRVDDNQAFGVYRTSGAAWVYDIDGTHRASLSRSTAFVAPTFNDLYFDDLFFFGNPDLAPETSQTVEAALVGTPQWASWELRLYRTDVDNLIVNVSSDPSDPFAAFTTANADKVRIDGAELLLDKTISHWDSSLALSWVDARNRLTNAHLQNRAQRSLKLQTQSWLRGHRVTVNLLAQSWRYADTANTQRLPGYGIVNVAMSRPLTAHWWFNARLENLFDKQYSTSTDFFGNTTNNTPRSLYVGISYR